MKLILVTTIFLILSSLNTNASQNQTININLKVEECQITVNTNKEIYESKEQIHFYNNITIKNNFTIKYHIIDSQNNIIKNQVITKNTNEKYFTPKESKTDQIITIISELEAPNCEANTKRSVFIKGNINLIEATPIKSTSTKIAPKTPTAKTTTAKTPANKTTITSKTKQTVDLNQQKSYEITPIDTTTTLLNPKPEENTGEVLFSSSEEKARNFAKYSIFGAVFLFIMGIKSNGNKNKNNS